MTIKMHLHQPLKYKQKGIAAAELVITLPVLLLLMMATAELGRAFFQYNTLEKSVRDAARYLSANATPTNSGVIMIEGIKDEIKNLVVYGNRSGNGTPILPELETDDISVTEVPGAHVQVSVSYEYQSILGNSIPSFGLGGGDIDSSFIFNTSTIMRAL